MENCVNHRSDTRENKYNFHNESLKKTGKHNYENEIQDYYDNIR